VISKGRKKTKGMDEVVRSDIDVGIKIEVADQGGETTFGLPPKLSNSTRQFT